MKEAIKVIEELAKRTDEVVLFHSASGKDSIAMLELIYPYFKRIVCCYMYIIKDLEHQNRFINYAKTRYPKIEWVQTPHYAYYSYVKSGYLGHKKNPKQTQPPFGKIVEMVKEKLGIEWAVIGFKQSDSMNRMMMLRHYPMEAINEGAKNIYPLSRYTNKQVLEYIKRKGLVKPEVYDSKKPSSYIGVYDTPYLLYLREKYPNDLKKVIAEYPQAERLLFEYDYGNKE